MYKSYVKSQGVFCCVVMFSTHKPCLGSISLGDCVPRVSVPGTRSWAAAVGWVPVV